MSLTQPDVVSGHLGHLSAEQTASLDDFKAQLSKDGLWTPETGVDDPTLLFVPSRISEAALYLSSRCIGAF
jgi:hypothetical protein